MPIRQNRHKLPFLPRLPLPCCRHNFSPNSARRPDRGFSWYSSVAPCKCNCLTKLTTRASFQKHRSSSFTVIPVRHHECEIALFNKLRNSFTFLFLKSDRNFVSGTDSTCGHIFLPCVIANSNVVVSTNIFQVFFLFISPLRPVFVATALSLTL